MAGVFHPGGYRSITESFSTGSSSLCLPRTGVSSPNAADAVVDDDEVSRQCSNRLSPLPKTETSGSCLGSSGDDQLEDDEMALEQPESESALSSKVDVKRGCSRGCSQNRPRFALSFFGTNPPLKILDTPLMHYPCALGTLMVMHAFMLSF